MFRVPQGTVLLKMQSLGSKRIATSTFPKLRQNANGGRGLSDTEILVKAGSTVTWHLQYYHRLSKCWRQQSAERDAETTDDQAEVHKYFVGREKNTWFKVSTALLMKIKELWYMRPCHLVTYEVSEDIFTFITRQSSFEALVFSNRHGVESHILN